MFSDRYYQTARVHEADVVVRITSDCPAIDPDLVDETIQAFEDQRSDYASNVLPRTYPRDSTPRFSKWNLSSGHGEKPAKPTSGNMSSVFVRTSREVPLRFVQRQR